MERSQLIIYAYKCPSFFPLEEDIFGIFENRDINGLAVK